jgi:hypothetical protein
MARFARQTQKLRVLRASVVILFLPRAQPGTRGSGRSSGGAEGR